MFAESMTKEILKTIESIDWGSHPQPVWNGPHDVRAALQALVRADSDAEAQDAYDRVLSVLGNNHAGTYYPVILPALPFLREIVEGGPVWARVGALDVLIDLLSSFEPEPGFETVRDSDGATTGLRAAIRSRASELLPASLERIRVSANAHERERGLATELAGILAREEAK